MTRASGPGQRILLIEDDAWIRRFLRDVLSDNGYIVTEAADGRTGVRLAREQIPDLILLDLAMPEVTGIEVLHQLQADPRTRSVRVVVISAYTGVLPPADAEHVAAVLKKPLDVDVLLEHVRQALTESDQD